MTNGHEKGRDVPTGASPQDTAASPTDSGAPDSGGTTPSEPKSQPAVRVVPDRLRAVHVLGVLCFHAGSIRAAAASPWSLLIGVLLVVSGGIARHYDKAALVAEWPLLLRGVGVSALNATLIFLLCCSIIRAGRRWPFWRAYFGFLGVFWLTAPMAWLYGIPYERWMEPSSAASWNYLTLGLVSLWRVALMTRVVQALFNVSGGAALVTVWIVADTVAIVGLFDSGTQLMASMGGVGMSPDELARSTAAQTALSVACLSWPLLAIGMLVTWAHRRGEWTLDKVPAAVVPTGAMTIAIASVLAWVGVAWPGHAALERERTFEQRLQLASPEVAHAMLAELDVDQMPPRWALEPDDLHPTLWELMELDRLDPLPEASARMLVPHVHNRARSSLHYFAIMDYPWSAMPKALQDLVADTSEIPERARPWLAFLVRHDTGLSPEDREGMVAVIRMAESAQPTGESEPAPNVPTHGDHPDGGM